MNPAKQLIQTSIQYPRFIIGVSVFFVLLLALMVVLPTLFPGVIPLPSIKVDTDPENMLSKTEPVRVFHNEMKALFDLNEIVVVGVVNDKHPEGVFNPETLKRVYDLTEYAKTLRGEAIGLKDPYAGVVSVDIIAPSTVDNIEQGGLGEVKFEWLMPRPPATQEEAEAVRDKASRIPFLRGTLVSESGKALALYLPLTSKDLSYRVYSRLRAKIKEMGGDDQWHITGLPVANDTFGVEMFIQMAISAPLAMLVIFLLMLFFFRKLVLILSPMILAMMIVIINMSLLVITGNTIHIMSSMIPIFIMPISILDSIHILSEFFDSYQKYKDRRKTIEHVMDSLFSAMLYTSLTSAAGFASLAITPIPPVQIFGMFVAIGVMLAWILTITFIPAFIMLIPERSLERFGAAVTEMSDTTPKREWISRLLGGIGQITYAWSRALLLVTMLLIVVAAYGISLIQVNDNPTRWFKAHHPIRVADRILNEHFGGTYMAYLTLTPETSEQNTTEYALGLEQRLKEHIENGEYEESVRNQLLEFGQTVQNLAAQSTTIEQLLSELRSRVKEKTDAALDALIQTDTPTSDTEKMADAWESLQIFIDMESQRGEVFKQPEALAYLEALQQALGRTDVVGKSNSITDIVKTVYRELMEGNPEYFRIPDSARAVAQCLITYESSHRPHDLAHFVTHDYRNASIWVQLKSGNNQDMKYVKEQIDAFVEKNPTPFGLTHRWFGLTYINVVWQEKMVIGMLQSFLGSFLVVLLMMVVLFRSGLWALLSMIPLTVTIGFIYGVVGLVGKDYDMPVAVLSSLTLGLAVDFAIHFLSRSRDAYGLTGNWKQANAFMFGEPARAIFRNVVAVAIGFTPLLAAPLVPYNTVGVFMAAILGVSGVATLFILPALVKHLEPLLFPVNRFCQITCRCGTCVVTGAVAAAAVVVNIQQFLGTHWTTLSLVALGAVLVSGLICFLMSRRQQCLAPTESGRNVVSQQ